MGEQEQEGEQANGCWVRRARLSKNKGIRAGWIHGRGGSRGRWGCDSVASASPAGSAAVALAPLLNAAAFSPANYANPCVGRNCVAIAKGKWGKNLNKNKF